MAQTLIPTACVAVGLIVMWGWSLAPGSPLFTVLTSVYEGGVTMKHLTATSFCVLGLLLQTPPAGHHSGRQKSLLFALLLLQVIAATSTTLPYAVSDTKTLTVLPGQPSGATIAAFLACGWWVYRRVPVAWVIPAIIGGVGVLGHLVQAPALKWYWPDHSSAMAAHTAAAFCLVAAYMRRYNGD